MQIRKPRNIIQLYFEFLIRQIEFHEERVRALEPAKLFNLVYVYI